MTVRKLPALLVLIAFALTPALFAQEGARDAEAVENRCGKPLKGDDTFLDNSGGHRFLKYERGTLEFTRVGNNGWRFVSAARKNEKGLTAEQMKPYMPCLQEALADSAKPEPLKRITTVQRMESSAKSYYRQLVIYVLLGLVLLGLVFLALSKRRPSEATDE